MVRVQWQRISLPPVNGIAKNLRMDTHEESSNHGSTPTEAPQVKQPWLSPELTHYGEVEQMTQGIAFRPSDGIANLT